VSLWLFASDLHGKVERYEKLLQVVEETQPVALFLGGDLLPPAFLTGPTVEFRYEDFVNDYLASRLEDLRRRLGSHFPKVFLILGNDDGRFEEAAILDIATRHLWTYLHDRSVPFYGFRIYGYAYVPPTPFRLKDWERYDVSRYVDPGCVSPEAGTRSVSVRPDQIRYGTIEKDLSRLAAGDPMERAIFLFHAPPHKTNLDRAALDGKKVDHVPLDVHVGSIAIRRFIQSRQPLLTLHGHVHESARLTGSWRDRIGRTHMFTAAHDGPELALVRFDPDDLDAARRVML
jgi:Icc-related predicted phosphoesterase